LVKIKELANPELSFEEVFGEISKNSGISFIALDPSGSVMQLFHHNTVIGGSWDIPSKTCISILGFDNAARPVQIAQRSIKVMKVKTESLAEVITAEGLKKLEVSKSSQKIEFHHRNIIPIPHLLTKTFLALEEFDPLTVAHAFFVAMMEHDKKESLQEEQLHLDPNSIADIDDAASKHDEQELDAEVGDSKYPPKLVGEDDSEEQESDVKKTTQESSVDGGVEADPTLFLPRFLHVLQFCNLCHKKKVSPIAYSIVSSPVVDKWFDHLWTSSVNISLKGRKRQNPVLLASPDSANSIESPDKKMSKKDQCFIHAMLKLHDTMDRNYKEKSDKEPGFARLEEHRKNLILNASAKAPYQSKASKPTEFYLTFLAKKSQFKAKDLLVHQLNTEKVAFNPSSSFANNLWNCEFFWLLPDSPSGVSIFFCPETKSANASEIEKERILALADKVNISDIEKLSKQNLYMPNTVMDLVWMTQNFYAVIKLCFGPSSHSAMFLKGWADHIYENRLMYTTLHSADPFFFAKVLYAIDNALQKHWRSCSISDDRLEVNDRVLYMQDVQDSILDFSFARNIPKAISTKISNYLENKEKDGDGKNGKYGNGLGKNKFKDKKQGKDDENKEDVLHNNDKSHPYWRIKDGENFSKVFYANQKHCPKTSDGKMICMKFLIRGMCDTSCTRAHSLSKEDSKNFDEFIAGCRERCKKPDF